MPGYDGSVMSSAGVFPLILFLGAGIGFSVAGVTLITAAVPIGLGTALFVNAAQRDL